MRNRDEDERGLESLTGNLHHLYARTDGGRLGLPVMFTTQIRLRSAMCDRSISLLNFGEVTEPTWRIAVQIYGISRVIIKYVVTQRLTNCVADDVFQVTHDSKTRRH